MGGYFRVLWGTAGTRGTLGYCRLCGLMGGTVEHKRVLEGKRGYWGLRAVKGGTVGYCGVPGVTAGYPVVSYPSIPQCPAGKNSTLWTAGYSRVRKRQGTGYSWEQGTQNFSVPGTAG